MARGVPCCDGFKVWTNESRSIGLRGKLTDIIIIIIIHSFYIALFSELEQTQCAHVACDSEWVTVSFKL